MYTVNHLKPSNCLNLIFFIFLTLPLYSQVSKLENISPITINKGEKLNVSDIVTDVTINNEAAQVNMNYENTSILAEGTHKIVFTALTFSGLSETFETTLDVNQAGEITNKPTFKGLKDYTISEGKMLDFRVDIEAKSFDDQTIPYIINIKNPEYLAPGTHTIYLTCIDKEGKSQVSSIQLTVNSLEQKYKRVELARLGKHLYNKYFEPARYADSLDNVYTYCTYNVAYSTEPGLHIQMYFENVKYDYFSFDPAPLKLECLMGRLLLYLKELRHDRYFWRDQAQIVISLSEFMPFDVEINGKMDNVKKNRGIYGLSIPIEVFKKENFVQEILASFERMLQRPINSPTRKIRHRMFKDEVNGIRILYYQEHSGTLWDAYKDKVESGEVNLEEDLDLQMIKDEYESNLTRFNNGEFGPFTNPKAPLFNKETP